MHESISPILKCTAHRRSCVSGCIFTRRIDEHLVCFPCQPATVFVIQEERIVDRAGSFEWTTCRTAVRHRDTRNMTATPHRDTCVVGARAYILNELSFAPRTSARVRNIIYGAEARCSVPDGLSSASVVSSLH